MKTIQELTGTNVPIVIIDDSLDKPDHMVLFPKKVAKAKAAIARIGLPRFKRIH